MDWYLSIQITVAWFYFSFFFCSAKQLIRDAVMQNDFLRHLDKEQVTEIVECMYEKCVEAGEYVIKEGEAGAHLYVAGGERFFLRRRKKFF